MSDAMRQAMQFVNSLALTNRTFDKPRMSTRKILFVDSSSLVIDD
jgi:hypothetical protein